IKQYIAWTTVLSGCKQYGDVERAKRILEYIKHLPSANVLMANIYATMGFWDEHAEVRTFMNKKKLKKIPGISCVKIGYEYHTFLVEDRRSTQEMIDNLHELRTAITKKYGYVPDESCILKDIRSYEKKVDHLWQHSEKLALSLALLKTEGEILITKNLR